MLRVFALPDRDRVPVLVVLFALVALAWVTLLDPFNLGTTSALDHEELFDGASWGEAAAKVPLFAGAWALMTTAMMLASTLPTQQAVAHVSSRRGNISSTRAALLFAAAYLSVWSLFGFAAFGADLGLHQVVDSFALLDDHKLLVPAALLLAAGLYQFSSVKDRCLTVCRTPMGFVLTRWKQGTKGILMMGLDHGLYCLGCCWPLMLLMFAYASSGLALMALAAVYFFVEKALAQGQALSRATGVALAASALALFSAELVS